MGGWKKEDDTKNNMNKGNNFKISGNLNKVFSDSYCRKHLWINCDDWSTNLHVLICVSSISTDDTSHTCHCCQRSFMPRGASECPSVTGKEKKIFKKAG